MPPEPGRPLDPAERAPLPRTLLVGALLVAIQGAALVVVGLADGVATLTGDPFDLAGSLLQAASALLAGAGLLAAAEGLRRRRAVARGPVLAVELLGLPVGYQLLYVSAPVGVVVLTGAVAVLVLLLHPASAGALRSGPADA